MQWANESWQQPSQSMLCDQASACVRQCHFGATCNKAYVAIKRQAKTHTRSSAVHGSNERLVKSKQVAIPLHDIVFGVRREGFAIGSPQNGHVHASTKRSASTSQHHTPDSIILLRSFYHRTKLNFQSRCPSVQPIGTIEGNQPNAILYSVIQFRPCHWKPLLYSEEIL